MTAEDAWDQDALLWQGTPEQRAFIALSLIGDDLPSGVVEGTLRCKLDWSWILMQALKHKVPYLLWDNLKCRELVDLSLRSGSTRRVIIYLEQLSYVNQEKNRIWLAQLEHVFTLFAQVGLPLTCIKGSALIGDIYTLANRMMSDIDCLIPRETSSAAAMLLKENGFDHGVYNPVSGTLDPLAEDKRRFWILHGHVMPKFYKDTGSKLAGFFKLSLGYDFFDPADTHSMPSDTIIACRQSKAQGSALFVPDPVDTILGLCSHIYREAVSASYAFVGDNWQLAKFVDLRTFIRRHDTPSARAKTQVRAAEFGLMKIVYFALYYARRIYGDPVLNAWRAMFDPGDDTTFLTELVDGGRSVQYPRPFQERFFDTGAVHVPELDPVWYRFMNDDDW